jgi:hypothetical protein
MGSTPIGVSDLPRRRLIARRPFSTTRHNMKQPKVLHLRSVLPHRCFDESSVKAIQPITSRTRFDTDRPSSTAAPSAKIIEQVGTTAHSNAAVAWRRAWSNSRPDSSWGCDREGTARVWDSNRPGNGRGTDSSPTATAWGNSHSAMGIGKCRNGCTTPAGQPSRPRHPS